MKVDIHVTAFEKRRPMFEANLQTALPYAMMKVKEFWDDGMLGCSGNFRRSLSMIDADADAILCFQEDISLSGGFWDAFDEITARWNRKSIVSFYTPDWNVTRAAVANGKCFVRTTSFRLWNQAILLPRELAVAYPHFVDKLGTDFPGGDDYLLRLFSLKHKCRAFYTVPSLVQHIGADDSAIGNSNRKALARYRRSGIYIDYYKPGSVDWNFANAENFFAPATAEDRKYLGW